MSNSTAHPDHIADATKKVQPAPKSSGWGTDTSTGREILVYGNCSVIEDERARQVLAAMTTPAPLQGYGGPLEDIRNPVAQPAPAPMLEDVKWAMRELNAYAAQNPGTPLSSMYATISAHITDLTRRLAKVEEKP